MTGISTEKAGNAHQLLKDWMRGFHKPGSLVNPTLHIV
jgi:hypothetical protein